MCSGLEKVFIPKSVTSIGSSAFCKCTGKASINCNGGDFSSSDFDEIVIGNEVESLGYFISTYSLSRIELPETVTGIPEKAFFTSDYRKVVCSLQIVHASNNRKRGR